MPLWLLLLLLIALFAGLVFGVGASSHRRNSRRAVSDDIDEDELAAAEREVAELDASTSAADADEHLPDWGPGAPRPRSR